MHYAGKNLHIVYIHPTHEKLKTHFGFSLTQFILKAIWSTGAKYGDEKSDDDGC